MRRSELCRFGTRVGIKSAQIVPAEFLAQPYQRKVGRDFLYPPSAAEKYKVKPVVFPIPSHHAK